MQGMHYIKMIDTGERTTSAPKDLLEHSQVLDYLPPCAYACKLDVVPIIGDTWPTEMIDRLKSLAEETKLDGVLILTQDVVISKLFLIFWTLLPF